MLLSPSVALPFLRSLYRAPLRRAPHSFPTRRSSDLPGRLILAVGAGGNRDEGKRFFMGEAAAQGADVVVIADDNPRFEDPATIRAEVRRGAESVPGIKVLESDSRRAAVELCAELATEADTVLFVGKGHETTQDVRG